MMEKWETEEKEGGVGGGEGGVGWGWGVREEWGGGVAQTGNHNSVSTNPPKSQRLG